MTDEERVDRLRERHEALTQPVLMRLIQQGIEARFSRQFDQLPDDIERLSGTVENLADIAKSHERRIDNLEDGRTQ